MARESVAVEAFTADSIRCREQLQQDGAERRAEQQIAERPDTVLAEAGKILTAAMTELSYEDPISTAIGSLYSHKPPES